MEPGQDTTQNSWYNPPATIQAVLCYIKDKEDRYLLLRKAKGRFGEGFWNAPGGKLKLGESLEQAVKREVFEETGLSVFGITHCGDLTFYFGHDKEYPDWTAVVYKTTSFSGQLRESEEGKLKWFSKWNIPYELMWEDDRHWLPILISGGKFNGTFEFTPNGEKIVDYKVIRL